MEKKRKAVTTSSQAGMQFQYQHQQEYEYISDDQYKDGWEDNDFWKEVDDTWEEVINDNNPLVDDKWDITDIDIPLMFVDMLYIGPDQQTIGEEISLRQKIAIITSTILRPSENFETQLCIDRVNTMPNLKKVPSPMILLLSLVRRLSKKNFLLQTKKY